MDFRTRREGTSALNPNLFPSKMIRKLARGTIDAEGRSRHLYGGRTSKNS